MPGSHTEQHHQRAPGRQPFGRVEVRRAAAGQQQGIHRQKAVLFQQRLAQVFVQADGQRGAEIAPFQQQDGATAAGGQYFQAGALPQAVGPIILAGEQRQGSFVADQDGVKPDSGRAQTGSQEAATLPQQLDE
jgi:hypothetical protein